MFSGSGIGEFFKPLSAPSRAADAASAVTPVRKAGEEGGASFGHDENPHEQPHDNHEARRPDDFADDVTRLSLPALRHLLTGDAGSIPPVPAGQKMLAADVPDTDMPPSLAVAAYRHAGDAAPPAVAEIDNTGSLPPDAEEKVLLMISKLEKSGILTVTVQDGQSIYDALVRMSRDFSGE